MNDAQNGEFLSRASVDSVERRMHKWTSFRTTRGQNNKHQETGTAMDTTTIGLVVAALVVGVFYMQRRRARLSRDEE
jgi:hypothetical protein